jgi:hypothetical protein
MKENKRHIIKERAGELGHIDCHYLSKDIIVNSSKRYYLVCVIDPMPTHQCGFRARGHYNIHLIHPVVNLPRGGLMATCFGLLELFYVLVFKSSKQHMHIDQ